MLEVKNEATANNEVKDICDMMELLKNLTKEEKHEVKGIMIGLQMSKDIVTVTQIA